MLVLISLFTAFFSTATRYDTIKEEERERGKVGKEEVGKKRKQREKDDDPKK